MAISKKQDLLLESWTAPHISSKIPERLNKIISWNTPGNKTLSKLHHKKNNLLLKFVR